MSDPLREVEFAFPGPLRDALIAAIESGAKTSTTSLLRGYELGGEPLPRVGERGLVVDSSGVGVLTIETTGVEIVALGSVGLAHAIAEGEGHTTVAQWREAHEQFWRSPEVQAELDEGFTLDDDTLVVLERFSVVQP